jgi:hypothetical protein
MWSGPRNSRQSGPGAGPHCLEKRGAVPIASSNKYLGHGYCRGVVDESAAMGDVERLRLLASAIAGRTLEVAVAGARERTWTDGTTVFVESRATPGEQVRMVAVQASLVGAGSLEPGIVRQLGRGRASRAATSRWRATGPWRRTRSSRQWCARSSTSSSPGASAGRRIRWGLPALGGRSTTRPRALVSSGRGASSRPRNRPMRQRGRPTRFKAGRSTRPDPGWMTTMPTTPIGAPGNWCRARWGAAGHWAAS